MCHLKAITANNILKLYPIFHVPEKTFPRFDLTSDSADSLQGLMSVEPQTTCCDGKPKRRKNDLSPLGFVFFSSIALLCTRKKSLSARKNDCLCHFFPRHNKTNVILCTTETYGR
jgi:hypothetical protein